MFFALLLIYFVVGMYKGFASMLFSLITVSVILFVSLNLVEICLPFAEKSFGQSVYNFLLNIIDRLVEGEFGDAQTFEDAVKGSGVIVFFLVKKVLENVVFDGSLSAGQILAPSLTNIVLKILVFMIVFCFLFLFVKLIKVFLNKLINKSGLSVCNRLFGGAVGLFKGMVIFLVVFSILALISNILFIEPLNEFVQGGIISNFIYKNFIDIIF